jgi:hypothetical protein
MPDEFNPLDWQTGAGGGTPLNEANLDRMEAGIESADDRLDALEPRVDTLEASGGGGHVIQDEGSALTQRAALNFLGSGVTATDDSANNRTNVTIPGGASSGDPDGFITLDTGSTATAGTALNAAIAALPSTGGTIIVPAGTWTLDTGIIINKNGVIIQGAGMLASSLVFAPGTVATAIANADTTQRFVTIRDLHIDTTGASGGTAINASYFVNSQFERLRIGEGTTRPLRGIVFDALGTYYNTVRDCRINVDGAGSVGIYFANQSNSNWVQNVRILGTADTVGVDVVNVAHTNTLAHIDCEGTMGIGIRVGGYNTTLISPYIESITIGLQLLDGVEAFSCLGGIITECDTLNIDDQGADKPAFIGMWLQYDTYTRIPVESFKRTAQVLKDPGAATVSTLGTPTPTLTGHTSIDSSSGAFMDFATSTTTNNTVGAVSPFTVCRRDWDPRVDFRLRMGSSDDSIRVLVGLFSASPDAVPTPETIHGAWFRYDTSVDGTLFWRCVVAAGAAPLVVTTVAPVETNTANSFRIELNESVGRAIFFIDDAQVARISGATLPGLTQLLGWGVRVTTLTTASRNARWGATQIQHD